MRISKLWAFLAPAVLLLATPAASFASSYQIFDLYSDQGNHAIGVDNSGKVVIANSDPQNSLYFTFVNGISTGSSTTQPVFTADNGTSCTPAFSGGVVQSGVCNNGFQAFTGYLSGQSYPGIFVEPSLQEIFFGGGAQIFMNSLGDILFDNATNGPTGDQWYEAINLDSHPSSLGNVASSAIVTPEPASVLLLTTGLLAPIFFFRRRLASASR